MFFQLFFTTIVLDFLRFPIWWYSHGLIGMLAWARESIRGRERAIGLRIWVANLFVPMYGQTNWQGRIISFVFRLLLLVVRLLIMIIWIALVLVTLFLYIIWPVGALIGFFAVRGFFTLP